MLAGTFAIVRVNAPVASAVAVPVAPPTVAVTSVSALAVPLTVIWPSPPVTSERVMFTVVGVDGSGITSVAVAAGTDAPSL